MSESLAQRIRKVRKERGYTQTQLALEANISQGAIWQIENGEVAKSRHIESIAAILGVTPGWLEYGDGTKQSTENPLSARERRLLSGFRALSDADKRVLMRVLSGLSRS